MTKNHRLTIPNKLLVACCTGACHRNHSASSPCDDAGVFRKTKVAVCEELKQLIQEHYDLGLLSYVSIAVNTTC